MLLLILVLLISIPVVTPSYHIPKLGRYHTFLRIGKRHFAEPCLDPLPCSSDQQGWSSCRSLMYLPFTVSLSLFLSLVRRRFSKQMSDVFQPEYLLARVRSRRQSNERRSIQSQSSEASIVSRQDLTLVFFLSFLCRQTSL